MKKDDSRREPAAAQPAPAEGVVLAAVSALMEERQRYEAWISSLEAKRQATQEHVFQRVHADYTSRLEAVIVQLGTHVVGLRGEMESLTSRLNVLREDQQRADDERAEAELRAHVGEVSAADWERLVAASDEKLADYAARRDEVEHELTRTRALLEAAQRPVKAAPVQATAPRRSDKVSAAAAAETAVTADGEASTRAGSAKPVADLRVVHQTPLPAMPPIDQHALDIQEHPAAPLSEASPARTVERETSRKGSFDELAFLSSVVDTPSGSIEPAPTDQPDEKTRRDSFAGRSHDDSISNLSGDSPLGQPADRQHDGDSLLSRSTRSDALTSRDAVADGAKTLKCNECGAMNYPTEWYCERCGAELASL